MQQDVSVVSQVNIFFFEGQRTKTAQKSQHHACGLRCIRQKFAPPECNKERDVKNLFRAWFVHIIILYNFAILNFLLYLHLHVIETH